MVGDYTEVAVSRPYSVSQLINQSVLSVSQMPFTYLASLKSVGTRAVMAPPKSSTSLNWDICEGEMRRRDQ